MKATSAETRAVPLFQLYGEPPQDVDRAFLHVETISRRSALHNWTIRVHAHPDHHQILLVTAGEVRVSLEDRAWVQDGAALVVVPALAVHGFQFSPAADGYVLTVSTAFLDEASERDPDLLAGIAGGSLAVTSAEAADLAAIFRDVERELVWTAPGRRIAIKLNLQRILIAIGRRRHAEPASQGGGRSRDAAIVLRFRDLIEREFRRQPGLDAMARQLGVSAGRLNAACRAMTGRSALALVHARILVEAKRNLLYTALTVGEVARSVGFADPAYFNRFFSRRTGLSPGAFRSADRSGADPL